MQTFQRLLNNLSNNTRGVAFTQEVLEALLLDLILQLDAIDPSEDSEKLIEAFQEITAEPLLKLFLGTNDLENYTVNLISKIEQNDE